MGSRAITTMTIGLCLLLGLTYYKYELMIPVNTFLSKIGIPEEYLKLIFPDERIHKNKSSSDQEGKLRLTSEELRKYDGGPDSKGLYLAILGQIFDVEKGAQHYRPGGGYAFFSGRDATRAYITGDFSEQGLTDNILDLSDSALAGIEDWISFYKEEYKFIGYVVGRYYDKNGQPTEELVTVQNKLNNLKNNKYAEEKQKELFPPCNSEWSKEIGSRVWCSEKSGGVERSWAGVPRQLVIKGKDPRCVCVKNVGPPSTDPDSTVHNNRGDLDHPDLNEYPGCPVLAESCSVEHP